jgi:hypothetical protein
MRSRRASFAFWLCLLPFAGVAQPSAWAEVRPEHRRGQQPAGEKKPPPPKDVAQGEPGKQGQANARSPLGVPPKWDERLRQMSPEEQERFMRNNARFQSLPPGRQAQIRQRLQRWNSLSPAERNAIRDRERVWEQMSPQQREYARNELLPRWRQIPQDRKQLILGRLRTLQNLSPPERRARLNNEDFLRGLNPDEREILRRLGELRAPPPS